MSPVAIEDAQVDSAAARFAGVRKRFGYHDILRGINLVVPRGCCFALFGPNGAGKSTLLRVLSTQWTFSAGRVDVLGLSLPKERHSLRRKIGAVFHDPFLRSELTLDENMRFACDLYGLKGKEVRARIDELLEQFSLKARRGDFLRTFSQGMTKRASIVRSLLHDPALWILDEPFSGLDPSGQALLEEMIRSFPSADRTVILVTHNEERGKKLSHLAARLADGVVVEGPSPVEEVAT